MWNIALGFAVFAALAIYALSQGGDIDMGGEKHGATWADVQHLVDCGLVLAVESPRAVPPAMAPDNAFPFEASLPRARSAQARYVLAKPLATQLTASLGLKGFRLTMAVESAAGCDELLLLLPKIEAALGPEACQELSRALKD